MPRLVSCWSWHFCWTYHLNAALTVTSHLSDDHWIKPVMATNPAWSWGTVPLLVKSLPHAVQRSPLTHPPSCSSPSLAGRWWSAPMDTSLQLIAMLFANTVQCEICLHCWNDVLLSHAQFVGHSQPFRLCCTKLLLKHLVPSLYYCKGLSHLRCKTLHLPSLNFVRILSAHFSIHQTSFWMACQPSSVDQTTHSDLQKWYRTLLFHCPGR